NLAQIMGGFVTLLEFARKIKAVTQPDAVIRFRLADAAVRDIAATQKTLIDTSDPAQHFLELLRAALDGHLAYLQSATDDGRGYPGDGGPEGAESLGWIDWNRREAFVLPEVALRLTGRLAEDSGTLHLADKRQLAKALDAPQHLATRKKNQLIIEKRLF